MKVIITGGTGLIGGALAKDLASQGHQVIVLSRNPVAHPAQPGITLAPWDGKTASGWGQHAEGADAIVNLAGDNLSAGRWSDERKRRILESRVNAGKAVVEAIQAASIKPRVLIQSSAVGYYGPHGDEPLPESTPPGNDFLAQVCQQWEASTQEVEALGVRRAIIRTGVVLSRTGGVLAQFRLPFTFFVGGPLGSGKQWFPWIHMTDEVSAIRFLIDAGSASGAYNLTAPNPLTNAQFAAEFGKAMGRPSWMPVPSFALKLLFGEMSTVILDGQRAMPTRLEQAGYKFRFPQALPALQDLLR